MVQQRENILFMYLYRSANFEKKKFLLWDRFSEISTLISSSHHLDLNCTGEHRASTYLLHASRFLASTFTSLQHLPLVPTSFITVLRHVVFGRPGLRDPWEFQSNEYLAISLSGRLNVWPIHFHFLRVTIVFTCSSSANFHKSEMILPSANIFYECDEGIC